MIPKFVRESSSVISRTPLLPAEISRLEIHGLTYWRTSGNHERRASAVFFERSPDQLKNTLIAAFFHFGQRADRLDQAQPPSCAALSKIACSALSDPYDSRT